ncbi:MAG: hypothetical protein PWQ59_2356 [Thermoanaerobacterium sp.]|jgi:DNA-binding helix-hairpin-helix protein with protein kinase domain|nr:hypothetical protein [Thermoanaerobacterium sp.]MDK2877949.1 hypothetical protein [Thermoanaerobacteraceae bacterium]MDN5300787.1 hypothetical protein [Thermoanaerobacteraceae bacterium]
MKVYNSKGDLVFLGPKIASGGEGSVFDVNGYENVVAKIYHKSLSPDKSEKLILMPKIYNDRLRQIAAWPIDTLHSSNPSGPVIGFLMPKITGYKAIHKLYGPKTRLSEFPEANWDFLIHTSANLARAFSVMHEFGHVVGDINHGNILVSTKATVMFIDCDSFQIKIKEKYYLCEVGVSTHQPPEFQRLKSYSGVIRTPNHDNFGLAVLIFQLLFMGRHPYSGRYHGPGDMSLERSIREYRFAYGNSALLRQMEPPPGTLSLNDFPPEISKLFERAFLQEGTYDNRPKAAEWVSVLENFTKQLKECSYNPAHKYWSKLTLCPWCNLEKNHGIFLFTFKVTRNQLSGTFNIELIWAQINAVPSPGPAPGLPSLNKFKVSPNDKIKKYGDMHKKRLILSVLLVIISTIFSIFSGLSFSVVKWIIIATVVTSYKISQCIPPEIKKEVQDRYNKAKNKFQNIMQRWEQEAGEESFIKKKSEFSKAVDRYKKLPSIRAKRFHELEKNLQKYQFETFLESHSLDNAQIKGIGPGRKATLQSYGIETAADIDYQKIISIPGFGHVLTTSLVYWRKSIESQFRFDPSKGVDPKLIAKLDNEINQEKVKLEQILLNGVQELKKISSQIIAKRKIMLKEIEMCMMELAQAEADFKAL